MGRDYIFKCKTGKSVIDITLSRNLKLKVDDWKVRKAYNHSDHNTIKYDITTDIIEIKPHRSYNTADWNSFKTGLQKLELHIPKIITQDKLEKMGKASRTKVLQEFDEKIINQRYLELAENILHEKKTTTTKGKRLLQ